MSNLELAKEICAEIRKTHKKPVLRFQLEPVEAGEPGLLDSKVGGTPYLPRNMVWPQDKAGSPLVFLAQVNCEALQNLPDFPHTGLLQFFIGNDDVYGMDFDDMTRTDGFQVLYHPDPDPSVILSDIPCPSFPENNYDTPLGRKPCRMVFGPVEEQSITEGDYSFENLFVQAWNRRCPEQPLEKFWDVFDLLPEPDSEEDEEELEGGFLRDPNAPTGIPHHQLGGYPFFTQSDPRSYGQFQELDVLLFQLDSDMRDRKDLVLWGDCGVGGFFINREALQKLDFSRVGYNWDCC